ncbi:MAG: hypothetical protein Q8P67_12280 [archaeon]|nr:hypothetical protein [archaeon]
MPSRLWLLSSKADLSPSEMSLFAVATEAPWVLKPLFFFWCQTVPFFGSHRRSYFMASCLLGAAAWLGLSLLSCSSAPPSFIRAASLPLFLVLELQIALSDLLLDLAVVDRLRRHSAASVSRLQALCASLSLAASLLVGFFSAPLHASLGPSGLLAASSCLSLALALLSSFSPDPPRPPSAPVLAPSRGALSFLTIRLSAVASELSSCLRAFEAPSIWGPSLFLLAWQALPGIAVSMHYFFTHIAAVPTLALREMDFSVKLSTVAALWIFDWAFSRLPVERVFPRVALLSGALLLPSLLLSSATLPSPAPLLVNLELICRTNGAEFLYRSALLLAAEICHSSGEPAFYSVLMAVMNIGEALQFAIVSGLLAMLGIGGTSFSNLSFYVVLAILAPALPIFLLSSLLSHLHPSKSLEHLKS